MFFFPINFSLMVGTGNKYIYTHELTFDTQSPDKVMYVVYAPLSIYPMLRKGTLIIHLATAVNYSRYYYTILSIHFTTYL